ncbi:dynein regulatory complex subunit 2 [Mugil cephalus]|uniref:dynein regulatory complex subunit 2 n=1 Tax=Mugil cephalus TaxID=48193 RepID=UPI001FB62B94|nr:dynein regulatory complex subunit 2 [Mugil cephalus]XP_047463539.1 dynein regulatory complex subunit 2 [Mugil cephalus]
MPKKGKKDGMKTEEERLVLLQQKAQAEEEMAKKKEETLTLFLKDKLQKEQRNTVVNLLKLDEGWRTILRHSREAELRKDMSVLRQTSGRQLDDLDSVIQKLVRDLEEAELQAAQVQRAHLQHVESLKTQQDKQLESLEQQWERCLQDLSAMFSCERKQMLSLSQQQRVKLSNQKLFMDQQDRDDVLAVQTLFEDKLALHQSSLADMMADVKVVVNNQESIKQQQKTWEENLHEVQHLDMMASSIQKKISVYLRRNKKLQDRNLLLRDRLTSSTTRQSSMENDLTAAKKQVNRQYHELRDQLTRARAAARKQLMELSVQSDDATKKLQAVIAKAEKVLRVAELCCKLERQQDRVSPSSSSSSSPSSHTEGQNRTTKASDFMELQQLLRRLNAAVQQREALRRHGLSLSRENQQLQVLLRRHQDALDGGHAVSVSVAVTRAPTTATAGAAPPAAARRHAVIEAAHAVKHSL